jgi:enoyl-CoA hydratase/carnithine racemase
VPDEAVLYEVADHVATVTINNPERRNALSAAVMSGLMDAFVRARADRDVRVVVLTGAGDKAFCAGADLSGQVTDASFLEQFDGRGEMVKLFGAGYGLGKPLIAKVRGFALAGGFGLALLADIVIAADDAVFGTPEINVGMWPMMITVPMLRSMPPKVALELQMTGRRVPAEEGVRLGFVNRAVPVAELDAAVAELAAGLAEKSPAIMRLGRDAFYRVLDQSADDALAYLHAGLTLVAQTEDHREGIRAFAEKRKPDYTGR